MGVGCGEQQMIWGGRQGPGHAGPGEARTPPEVRAWGHSEVKFRGPFEAGLNAQALAKEAALRLWPG